MEDRRSRERELREQMEMLRTLVEAGTRREAAPTASGGTSSSEDKVKLSKLTETDDIEAYLTTFERMMAAYEVPENRWPYKLAPMLTGKAQQAYAAMEPARAADYAEVKTAILCRYDISEETYRQRFRVTTRKEGETYQELATRTEDLMEKWLKSCKTVKDVKQRFAVEQFLTSLPAEIRIWVRERDPKTCAAAGELAHTFVQARKPQAGGMPQKGAQQSKKPQVQETRRCNKCGIVGHIAVDCKRGVKPAGAGQGKEQQKQGKYREPIRCFECGERGHIAVNCPKNAYFCRSGEEKARSEPQEIETKKQDMTRVGRVEGTLVSDILLDTGCDRTLVRKELVPVERMVAGEVPIRCAHGDVHMYPLAELEIEIGGSMFAVEAGVTDYLPVSVLLGKAAKGQQGDRCSGGHKSSN